MQWKIPLFVCALFLIPAGIFFASRVHKTSEKTVVTVSHPPSLISKSTAGSDLSYIVITADNTATIAAVNHGNQSVGLFFVQGGIRPPQLSTMQQSPMKSISTYYIQQPENEEYKIAVATKTTGEVIFYLYDRSGNVVMRKFNQPVGQKIYIVTFEKDGASSVQ